HDPRPAFMLLELATADVAHDALVAPKCGVVVEIGDAVAAQDETFCRQDRCKRHERVSLAAMRSASLVATSSLLISGHSSTPSCETMRATLRSPPITPPGLMPLSCETSLATMRSAPFLASLRRAF